MKKAGVIGIGAALILATLAVLYTASAHMGGFGYGYGMPGMMGGYGGFGYPMMGYGMGYGYDGDEIPATQQVERKVVEVSGVVSTVYSMAVVLEDGKYLSLPWWFAADLGIKTGDSITAKGFEYGNTVIPVYIEVNGKIFGDENSEIPVWMQGFQQNGYGYGYDYGYGYHCPMMWW